MIEVRTLGSEHVDQAVALFTASFRGLRASVPVLPNALEDPLAVTERLGMMTGRSLAAVENGRLLGYLAWWEVDGFRGTPRRGAYVPEYGHAALPGRQAEIYRALYRAAASEWTAAGCQVHAITLFANDVETREAWFWNGFGLAVVDAVREARPLDEAGTTSLTIHRASEADVAALAELDAEHVQHYAAAPVFMALPSVDTAASFTEFLARPKNSTFMAFDDERPAGFMRFTGYDFDAVAALESDTAALCNGAYMRPAYRGRRAGVGMLQAALQYYSSLGFTGVYVNFESFNPEAASFWPRYFTPACFSMQRVPEVLTAP